MFDEGLWGPFESAVIDGAWTIEAVQASTGGTVGWLMEIAGARWPADRRCQSADAEAAEIAPGADGLVLLDFWQGSRTPVKDPAGVAVVEMLKTPLPSEPPGSLNTAWTQRQTPFATGHVAAVNEWDVTTPSLSDARNRR